MKKLIVGLMLGIVLCFGSVQEVSAADAPSCATLLHPLETKVGEIKDRGGIWGMFDQYHFKVNHTSVTLKLDSKITVLISRLNHLCATQNGVPLEEVAQILVPQLKAKGEQVVMEELINIGHIVEEAERLITYARFAESNLNRKLEFDQIIKTIAKSQLFVNRLMELSKKIGQVGSEKIMNDSKVLISDIEKFLTTDSYLILADKETDETQMITEEDGMTSDTM